MKYLQGFTENQIEQQFSSRGIQDESLLKAFRFIDRSLFVPLAKRSQSYEDSPISIGLGQTISQPYIVALMTMLLGVQPDNKILEIGTGSGYQTAILAFLGAEVWTIEFWKELQLQAIEALRKHGLTENVHFVEGDGYEGIPKEAPFDRIIVTCAPDHVPPPLLKQLGDPGIMILPVGEPGRIQRLLKIEKKKGLINKRNVSGVVFVPMLRKKEGPSQ